jgi:hypothetical protein
MATSSIMSAATLPDLKDDAKLAGKLVPSHVAARIGSKSLQSLDRAGVTP